MTKTNENDTLERGRISVHTENIFPIIKRSLYSDHEIFLRELVSNAVDATQKVKHLASIGKYNEELGDLTVKVEVDKEARTITIKDRGIGLSADEVKKYINQVAFSGAEEFVKKFKATDEENQIIGQFGLGFYSAFMVSERVDIQSRSYKKNTAGVEWSCDGSTEFTLDKLDRKDRGTDIILHVDEDSDEFLENERLAGILNKYCKFLPIPVEFDGNVINNVDPIWNKTPSTLTDEDYQNFFKELYPFSDEPLFWIHLNVDYPFNLTGILFFPKIKNDFEATRKDRIHLYSRQVFITDKVEDIVPEYLQLLQGVIDSPDIPLNVSRSFLQTDSNVRKISNYITKKVADKLKELFDEDRGKYEEKWPDVEVFVKYGQISDEKFGEMTNEIALFRDTSDKYFTLSEYQEAIKENQTDKDGNLVFLYSSDRKGQDAYISSATAKGYSVVMMDGILDSHYIGHLERKLEKSTWKRVDADVVDKLIPKEDAAKSTLEEEEEKSLREIFEEVKPNELQLELEPVGESELPVIITRPEFMRRMKDMARTGGMSMMGELPEQVNLIINTSHPLARTILDRKTKESKKKLAKQAMDLALLSQNMLEGEELTEFIKRSVSLLK